MNVNHAPWHITDISSLTPATQCSCCLVWTACGMMLYRQAWCYTARELKSSHNNADQNFLEMLEKCACVWRELPSFQKECKCQVTQEHLQVNSVVRSCLCAVLAFATALGLEFGKFVDSSKLRQR